MRYTQTLFFLLCLGGITTSVFAQKRNYILYKDTVTGKDTVIMNVSFANENYKKKQYAVSIVNGENRIIHTYKAEDIAGYKEGRTLYVSRSLSVDGEVRRVLLPRVYWKDNISIYSFIPDKGQRRFYAQIPNDSLLLPLKGSPETNGINPLVTYLETFPVAQNETARKYIRSMKPTPDSFESRYRICRTGNLNYIPEIRWGVLAGAGLTIITYDDTYEFSGFNAHVGVFADIPIVLPGLSFHPELMFRSLAFKDNHNSEQKKDEAIYNRKLVVIPLLLRYTIVPIKGKVLPYFQAGAEIGITVDGNMQTQYMAPDSYGYWALTKEKYNVGDFCKRTTASFSVGMGLEVKFRPKHSAYIDLRYTQETQKQPLSGFYATLSVNL